MHVRKSRFFRLILIAPLIGIIAGLAGTGLVLLLHFTQHLAFGYSQDAIISSTNFLNGVSAASPSRRLMSLIFAGLIAGFGWFFLYRYGRPLRSIKQALLAKNPFMPVVSTSIHVLLQIITIALGSPLGREVAPRELAAMFTICLTKKFNFNTDEIKILLACAAGAGLAAVYNVPLGGALFTLEVLLVHVSYQTVMLAFLISAISTGIAWVCIGHIIQYPLHLVYCLDLSFLVWALLVGPCIGLVAFYFHVLTERAAKKAPKNWHLPLFCSINFIVIGVLAIYFPAILGNGKSASFVGFNENTSMNFAITLLMLRIIVIYGSLRAGAKGGLLMPSFANGVLLAIIFGQLWGKVLPMSSFSNYGLVGGVAFLAAAQNMPITAIVLAFEFTRAEIPMLIPILLSVLGSLAVFLWMKSHFFKKN